VQAIVTSAILDGDIQVALNA